MLARRSARLAALQVSAALVKREPSRSLAQGVRRRSALVHAQPQSARGARSHGARSLSTKSTSNVKRTKRNKRAKSTQKAPSGTKRPAKSEAKKSESAPQRRGAELGEDGVTRCYWANGSEMYRRYHDLEWGVYEARTRTDAHLFEFLLLEGFQAGLSWATILRKRENFRRAFDRFDMHAIAAYDEQKVQALLADAGIVRNRLKVRAAVSNARCAIELVREFGSLDAYFRGHMPGAVPQLSRRTRCRTTSPESDRISADLKRRGFRFVGSTIIYSHLQATGIINDHMPGCFLAKQCAVKQEEEEEEDAHSGE